MRRGRTLARAIPIAQSPSPTQTAGLDEFFEEGRNSPVRQKFSGCHCTPMQKRAPGRSIASMIPSGAMAQMSKPGAVCLIAW